jgi:hypothetical protein
MSDTVHLTSGRAAAVPRRKSLGLLPQQAANHQLSSSQIQTGHAHATRVLRSPKEGDPKLQPHNLAIEAAPSHHRFLTSWSLVWSPPPVPPPPLKGERERERAMGGSPSRSSPRDVDGRYGRPSSFPQQPQYGGYYDQGAQSSGYYAAPYQAPPPPAAAPRPRLDRRYSRIADDYNSVDQVRFAVVDCNCSSSARLNVSCVWISDLSYRRSTELIRSVWSLDCSSSLGFVWISKPLFSLLATKFWGHANELCFEVNQPAVTRNCR